MKKTILFVVSLSLLAVSACTSNKAPERQGWDNEGYGPLYGNVESVTFIEYNLAEKFGEIIKDGIGYKEVYKFNQQGDVIEEVDYNSDGSLRWKHLYKYDSKGNMIEEASYRGDGSLERKDLYKYDSKGNKIEWAYYNCDGSLREKYLYKYDSKGNMIEEASYRGDGSLYYKYLY
ncbi:MAG: hypothetical protein IIV16_01055, partial [Alistipes sp.]|nr:hypothetical protein [Alistipes sp.]